MTIISILGGSGKLGHMLVSRALDLGYRVNVLAREPKRLKRYAESLTVIQGDAATGEGLAASMRGCRFVVCAISSTEPVIAQCMSNIALELQNSRVLERFVFISRVGVGDSRDQGRRVSGLLQPYLPVVKRPLFDDLDAAEGVLRISGLPYVIVRATMLTDDDSKHRVVEVDHNTAPPGRIPRRELADYILKSLGEGTGFAKGEVTVGTAKL
jgi:uncharacterized protein YbjT (DUF2867 family)